MLVSTHPEPLSRRMALVIFVIFAVLHGILLGNAILASAPRFILVMGTASGDAFEVALIFLGYALLETNAILREQLTEEAARSAESFAGIISAQESLDGLVDTLAARVYEHERAIEEVGNLEARLRSEFAAQSRELLSAVAPLDSRVAELDTSLRSMQEVIERLQSTLVELLGEGASRSAEQTAATNDLGAKVDKLVESLGSLERTVTGLRSADESIQSAG